MIILLIFSIPVAPHGSGAAGQRLREESLTGINIKIPVQLGPGRLHHLERKRPVQDDRQRRLCCYAIRPLLQLGMACRRLDLVPPSPGAGKIAYVYATWHTL